jgi:hypothetical protein
MMQLLTNSKEQISLSVHSASPEIPRLLQN